MIGKPTDGLEALQRSLLDSRRWPWLGWWPERIQRWYHRALHGQKHVWSKGLGEQRSYDLPQHVLVPRFEKRERVNGEVIWAATLPFFGFFAYGTSREEAGERLLTALGLIYKHHRDNVLADTYAIRTDGDWEPRER
jgi:hypothetical protein